MVEILLILPPVLLVAAVALILVGRHGRRIDRHPICPDCGFDLHRILRRNYRCPECGCNITPWHEHKVGNRRPIVPLVYAGWSLLPVAVLGCLLSASLFTDPVRAAPYKPLVLLRLDLRYGTPEARNVALQECLARFNSRRALPADLAPVVADVLAIQADPNAAWTTPLGDFVEALRAAGAVSPEHWRTYAAQSLTFELDANLQYAYNGQLLLVPRPRAAARTVLIATYAPVVTWGGAELLIDSVYDAPPAPAAPQFAFTVGVSDAQIRAVRVANSTDLHVGGQIFVTDSTAPANAPPVPAPVNLTPAARHAETVLTAASINPTWPSPQALRDGAIARRPAPPTSAPAATTVPPVTDFNAMVP